MAEAVAEGIKAAGQEAELLEVGNADAANGCSRKMHSHWAARPWVQSSWKKLRWSRFIEEIESLVSGKTILLFGSYGWGDGEWMRDWAERMKNAGAVLLREEGIITNDAPEDDMLEELKAAGQELAQKA